LIRATASLLAVLVSSVTFLAGGVSPASADGHPPTMLGPGDAGVSDIGGQAVIRYSKYGPVYIAGQQNTHLRIVPVDNEQSLRFRDTRTGGIKGSLPDRCSRETVQQGISVVCKVPPRFRGNQMFVQVWPRLGNDYVDGRSLSRHFRLWVLTDAGNDIVYGGAGADFVNGAKGVDRAWGGPGRDWLRGGPGADMLNGGPGKDRISQG
jgi:serralysin